MVSQPLRIAHVSATFPPYAGGTGNVCFYNARELARRGYEVHVYTAAVTEAPLKERLSGVQVYRLKPLLRLGNAPFLPALAGLQGYDLLHLHFPFFGGEAAALAARRARMPLLITYHQDVLLGGALGLVERVLRKTTVRWVLRSAQRVLFTSLDYSQASYARALLRGHQQCIGELPNGVDVEFFSPGASADPGKRQGQYVLLVASLDRAHSFKGLPVLFRALASLPTTVVCNVVGDGDLRPLYQQMAQALDLGERVRFFGRVSNASLVELYRRASVTVLPSTSMGEAFGLVLVESLACGTPVIASDLPGVRTVVTQGEDGWLAPPGDAAALAGCIQQALEHPLQARQMGARGREKIIQCYTWPRVTDRLCAIYQDVLTEFASRKGWKSGVVQ